MAINEHNYEAWFLDYAEGSLSAEQEAELMAFLEQHPALREELEEFELMVLDAPELEFDSKESLKAPEAAGTITGSLADDLLIGELEGTLSTNEKATLAEMLRQHPVLEAERTVYKNTVLQPDTAMVYADKAGLKRGGIIIPLFARRAMASATKPLPRGL